MRLRIDPYDWHECGVYYEVIFGRLELGLILVALMVKGMVELLPILGGGKEAEGGFQNLKDGYAIEMSSSYFG